MSTSVPESQESQPEPCVGTSRGMPGVEFVEVIVPDFETKFGNTIFLFSPPPDQTRLVLGTQSIHLAFFTSLPLNSSFLLPSASLCQPQRQRQRLRQSLVRRFPG